MKKRFLAAALLISSCCFGQPVIKLYGYSQVSTPGIVLDREAAGSQKPKPAIDFFIYFATTSTVKIQPAEIWIKGERFDIYSVQLVKTPVRSRDARILVNKTSQRVREIKRGKKMPVVKQATWLRKLTSENELVLAYYWNGKKYYKGLKKISELEPIFGE